MRQPAYELIVSLVAIVAIALGYLAVARRGIPQPTSQVGYTLGIVGFVLMLSTETLYSLRKRLPRFHFGRMSVWLQLHVFTGLVGPCLVLLHSGWKFHGLAGALTLVVFVVVLSGLVGRYIYTAVPRNLDGVEVAAGELEARIAGIDKQLQDMGVEGLGTASLAAALDVPQQGWKLVLGRPFLKWRLQQHLRRLIHDLGPAGQAQAAPLAQLLSQRQHLQIEVQSLEAARQLLAWWHLFHVPLSVALFLLAFVHIGAALYYSAFLR